VFTGHATAVKLAATKAWPKGSDIPILVTLRHPTAKPTLPVIEGQRS